MKSTPELWRQLELPNWCFETWQVWMWSTLWTMWHETARKFGRAGLKMLRGVSFFKLWCFNWPHIQMLQHSPGWASWSQVLTKVLQMCSSNSRQDAELLDAVRMLLWLNTNGECLSRDRPNTASAKLDLTWQRDMSISPKDVNLGFSVKIKPGTTTTKDSGDRTSETSVVQRSRNEQGKQDGQSTSSGSFGGTWLEKILLSFDNMLYLMEQEKMVAKTRLEAKYVHGMCMSLEAFLEMATRKKKQERWRSARHLVPTGYPAW